MFALSKIEWLFLAAALLACPGLSWSEEPASAFFNQLDRDGRIGRSEFSLIGAPRATAGTAPSAAAGATKPAPPPQKKE